MSLSDVERSYVGAVMKMYRESPEKVLMEYKKEHRFNEDAPEETAVRMYATFEADAGFDGAAVFQDLWNACHAKLRGHGVPA